MAQNGPPPTRGFGRYQARYRQIMPGLNQSLALKNIGKVKIDCCYLEDSTCGTLEQNPAWLLYLDIIIHQPRGCRLSSADITLTFGRDTETAPIQALPANNPRLGPQVTKYYGPKGLQDKPKEKSVTTERNLAPKIAALGNSGELGNIKGTASYVKSTRWLIRGQWQPVLDEQLGVSLYRKVNWYMEENTFDEQTLHSNSIHVGAVLRHDLDPLYVEVQIEGKLQGISGAFRFPPWDKPAIVISKFTPKNESKCLDNIAKALEDELTKKNQIPVPEMGEITSAAGPSTTGVATGTDAAAAPAAATASTTEAAPTTGAAPPTGAALTGSTPITGANLISLAQTTVSQIAPAIQAVKGNTGAAQDRATA